MTTVQIFVNNWTFALQNLSSIYQLGSNFVKQLFVIEIQKGGKVLLWNQVKSRVEVCYSELILVVHFFPSWLVWGRIQVYCVQVVQPKRPIN